MAMLGPVFDHGNELTADSKWSFLQTVERVLCREWIVCSLFKLSVLHIHEDHV